MNANSDRTIEQSAILRLVARHGGVAYPVSGTVHIISWCTHVGQRETFTVLDVVTTYSEARRVLGY